MNFLRNNRVLLMIVAALLLTNMAILYFFVKDNKKAPPSRPAWEDPRAKMQHEVGLSDDQMTRYSEIRKEYYQNMKPLFNEIRSARDSFFTLIYRPGTPDSVISKYASAIAAKQQEIDTRMIKYYWSLKDICTPDQLPKMDTFLKSITRRMYGGGRRGPAQDKNKK